MSKVSIVDFKPMRDRVSAAEWQTRVDLAACYRLVRSVRHDRPASTTTSRRACPARTSHFLINPSACCTTEITAS